MKTRKCKVCGHSKALTPVNFNFVKQGNTGWFRRACKSCHAISRRSYYRKYTKDRYHSDLIYRSMRRLQQKDWVKKNPDKVRIIAKTRSIKQVKTISDPYLKRILCKLGDTNYSDVTPQLLETAKKRLKLSRYVKQIKDAKNS